MHAMKSACESRYAGLLIRNFSASNKSTASPTGNFPAKETGPTPIENEFGLAPELAMTFQTREKSTSSVAIEKPLPLNSELCALLFLRYCENH